MGVHTPSYRADNKFATAEEMSYPIILPSSKKFTTDVGSIQQL